MATTTTELKTSDYGSNISISRVTYIDEVFQDQDIIFETNTDAFLPDSDEFDENWNVDTYIDDFLSYREFENDEEKIYVRNALHSSSLRYKAVDAYTEWASEQS